MRTMRAIGLLLATLLLAHGAVPATAAAAFPVIGTSTILPGGSVSAQATPGPGSAVPRQQRPPELEYLPRDEGRGGAREIGWLLIAAAIVLAIVIVVFVIRHRRSGRPG